MSSNRSKLSLVVLALLSGAGSLLAQVPQGQEIVTLSGRESVHELTLSTQVATSITLPSEVTLVTGYGLVVDAARAQEVIDSEALAAATLKQLAPKPVTIVHYAQAARDTLVFRAVRTGTPCYVTVRCGMRLFLFKFSVGEKANVAVMVSDKGPGGEGVVELKKEQVLKQRINFTSTELISILSRAKGRGFLESVNPDLYEGWKQRRDLELASGDDNLKATITEIQQWPQKDALVFRCVLESKSTREVRFKPGDVRVRAGDASYTVQLADSSGVVVPGRKTMLDLVLQGNEGGGKEHISIENDFRLEVPIDHSPPPPNDSLPPANPLLPSLDGPGGAGEAITPLSSSSGRSDVPMLLPLPSYERQK